MFIGGQAAFLEAGAWESSKLDQCDIASDIGVWFGPTFSDGVGEQKQTIKTVNGPFVISKESANDPAKEKVLMDFFEFYSSTEGTKIVAEETNILPVAKYNGTIDHEAHPSLRKSLPHLAMNGLEPRNPNRLYRLQLLLYGKKAFGV